MDVHPPKYGTIGFDPWPYGYTGNDSHSHIENGHRPSEFSD